VALKTQLATASSAPVVSSVLVSALTAKITSITASISNLTAQQTFRVQ